jgi:hypothetical protein
MNQRRVGQGDSGGQHQTGVKLINRLRRKVRVNMRLVMGAMAGPGQPRRFRDVRSTPDSGRITASLPLKLVAEGEGAHGDDGMYFKSVRALRSAQKSGLLAVGTAASLPFEKYPSLLSAQTCSSQGPIGTE